MRRCEWADHDPLAGFGPRRVARFGASDAQRLMNDEGIVRNRAKIEAAILNARCLLDAQREVGSFDSLLWGFVGGEQACRLVDDHVRGCFRASRGAASAGR
ncbi:MAG TPA: DNA-3-methyladenine glycosylase I [Polyangiaceae bacterium]|nr:DNA-3-methyladenine glycosylase I [Polyangiaceae bacterium]